MLYVITSVTMTAGVENDVVVPHPSGREDVMVETDITKSVMAETVDTAVITTHMIVSPCA